MKRNPNLKDIPDSPEYRSLRRQIAIALMIVLPTSCTLPLLVILARGERIASVIWFIWAVITIIGIVVIVRAATRIRILAERELRNRKEE